MTRKQQIIIQKAHEKISELRSLLDDLMYNTSEPIDDAIYPRIREAYDLICQANDKL